MKEIRLNKERVALVDDDNYEWLNQWKWSWKPDRHGGYATRIESRPVRRLISMSRLIMGEPEGLEVDHINQDKLDNRKENLRVCTTLENSRNKSITKSNKTGYKGVSEYPRYNCYRARISIDGKDRFLGYFDEIKDAAREYDKKAKELFGEFAVLNFQE